MNSEEWEKEDDDDEGSDAPEHFLINDRDRRIVSSGVLLLEKIIRSSSIKPSQLISVSKVLHVLKRLPRVSSEIVVSIGLSGPRRWFDDREICHYWHVDIEGTRIDIYSGGYFYRESTGGDSFTLMQWTAVPEVETSFNDYLALHWIVDDARPFDSEIAAIDLREAGFSFDVHDADNPFLEEEYAEDENNDE
jgi:hypothetical protein